MLPVASLNEGNFYSILLLIGAAALDFVLGDPWSWPHPVQAMGKVIELYSKRVIHQDYSPIVTRGLGVVLAVLLIGGTFGTSAVLLGLLAKISIFLRWGIEGVLLASCFAGRSLRASAEDVLQPLATGDLVTARERLSMYVGRDTANLSAVDIRRAVLETVSENAIDGVLAPLFYAILGAALGVAAPLALAYKAASTLDSMVGYKEPPYTDLGWFSARLEDVLTWLPCRLSVLTVAILSRRPAQVLRICQRDAVADPSPNAGWSECAYAAALGVQMGGRNTYRGQVKVKPLLGNATRPIDDTVIWQALRLTRWSFLLGLIVGGMLLVLWYGNEG
ncbi:MAG: adenosylcobinamide-phosphate synthase CbiB [Cyanobacteria bacterium J06621_11]